MLLISALSWPVLASSFVLELGEEHLVGSAGTFGRAFPSEESGWHYFYGAGGDFIYLPLNEDLTADHSRRRFLTGQTELVDHAIVRCPNGDWLHAAHVNEDGDDQSAQLFRYDESLELIGTASMLEASEDRFGNDMAVLCTETAMGMTVVGPSEGPGPSYFRGLDENYQRLEEIELVGKTRIMGGSLLALPKSDLIYAVGQQALHGQDFVISKYKTDWEVAGDAVRISSFDHKDDLAWRVYWPQGSMRIGNVLVVCHLGRDENEGFSSAFGNVYLSFFDLAWNLLEVFQVTFQEPPNGGVRPFMALDGDAMLVSWDWIEELSVIPLTLDLAALEAVAIPEVTDTADTAEPSTGDSGEPTDSLLDTAGPTDSPTQTTNPPPPPAEDGVCGCVAGSAGPSTWALVLGFLGAWRRRRDSASMP
jgi:MYXO-CTERM domain-containing protein